MNDERIAIITDSCADLPKDLAKKLGVTIIPLNVIFGEEVLKDGVEITSSEFYKRLATESKLPSTSQPTPQEFEEVYRDLLKENDRVVSIHLSEKLSGTLASAKIAAKSFGDKVVAFDSESISVGVALQVEAAAEAVKKGNNFEEIKSYLKRVRESTHALFTLDTLKYLEKGGRIGKAESLLGSVLNVKPLIIVREGMYHAFGKTRSQKKALKQISNYLIKISEGKTVKSLAIGHGMAKEAAEKLRDNLESALNIKASMVSEVGPVIGVHTGPGALGASIRFE
ncbi:MAG: DegV family protein [Clostridia bacterium]